MSLISSLRNKDLAAGGQPEENMAANPFIGLPQGKPPERRPKCPQAVLARSDQASHKTALNCTCYTFADSDPRRGSTI